MHRAAMLLKPLWAGVSRGSSGASVLNISFSMSLTHRDRTPGDPFKACEVPSTHTSMMMMMMMMIYYFLNIPDDQRKAAAQFYTKWFENCRVGNHEGNRATKWLAG